MAVQKTLLVLASVFLGACQMAPELPDQLDDQALLVMGYSTDFSEFDRGGSVTSGFVLESVNNEFLEPPLTRYQFIKLQPGEVSFSGHCFWRLRGAGFGEDDLWEPGSFTFTAQANYRYTIVSEIDDYKARCNLEIIETLHTTSVSD